MYLYDMTHKPNTNESQNKSIMLIIIKLISSYKPVTCYKDSIQLVISTDKNRPFFSLSLGFIE